MWIETRLWYAQRRTLRPVDSPHRVQPAHKRPSGILGSVNYAQLLLPDFTLILFGYLVCRYTALNRSVWQPVESLVYYLLFPVLLAFCMAAAACCAVNGASGRKAKVRLRSRSINWLPNSR